MTIFTAFTSYYGIEIQVLETLQNCDEVSLNDRELDKSFPTYGEGGILQALALQAIRSQLKTCMFRVMEWMKNIV